MNQLVPLANFTQVFLLFCKLFKDLIYTKVLVVPSKKYSSNKAFQNPIEKIESIESGKESSFGSSNISTERNISSPHLPNTVSKFKRNMMRRKKFGLK